MSQRALLPVTDFRVAGRGGVPVIPRPTPLTRLHYFDGKFLRASDLTLEQEYHRQLVQFANQAGGSGVVHGFDAVWTGGDALALGPGLALDPQGRTLFLPEGVPLSLAQLVAASRGGAVLISGGAPRAIRFAGFADCEPHDTDGGVPTTDGGVLYLLSLFHAEDLCGTEDVLGRLCADTCAGSTERPYILEGVLVRAVPITLETALASSLRVALTGRHLRSLVASAYFEDQRKAGGSLISGAGLRADAWCLGAAAAGGAGVPVGLFSRAGEAIRFFDAWTARRERIEPPNRRYWAGRMSLRPWDVFLAQVLQFQCQLSDCLGEHDEPADDPCAPAYRLLRDTSETFTRWLGAGGEGNGGLGRLEELTALRGRLVDAVDRYTALPRERLLIACGIVELPAAGYLPVVPSATLSVNQQVRRMMGEGVDLRFCVVRPDYVPHALEEAQHMERISLLAGLDDPAKKPRVDVLVPDGQIENVPGVSPGQGYVVDFELASALVEAFERLFDDTGFEPAPPIVFAAAGGAEARELGVSNRLATASLALSGAGRGEDLAGGGLAFHFAGRTPGFGSVPVLSRGDRAIIIDPVPGTPPAALWLTVSIGGDPFALGLHERTRVDAEAVLHHLAIGGQGNLEARTLEISFHGELAVTDRGAPRSSAGLEGRLTVVGHPPAGAPMSRSLFVREEVFFERADGKVTVAIPRLQLFLKGRAALVTTRDWPEPTRARVTGDLTAFKGTASGVAAELQLGRAFASDRLFALDERQSEEVSRPDHPAHTASIAALQRLGQALREAGFVDPRARKLFPPAAPATTDLTVKATLDWVFFHRRRDKTCGLDAARPTVPSRRYRVFHQVADRELGPDELLRLLRAGDGLGAKAIGTIEYAGGLPSIEGSHPALQAAWDTATLDGYRIVVGVIASHGDAEAEGDVLADARLDALTGLYERVTPKDPSARFEVLDQVPADLSVVGVDGLVLFVTEPPAVTTECHSAYLLRENTTLSAITATHARLAGTSFTEALFAPFAGQSVGSLAFVLDSAQPTGGLAALEAALPPSFRSLPAGQSLVALAVCNFDRTDAQTAVHLAQSDELARLLGARRLGTIVKTKPLPFGCPALTLLFLVKTQEIPDGGVLLSTDSTPTRRAPRRRPT
jgi:hypothetical protein